MTWLYLPNLNPQSTGSPCVPAMAGSNSVSISRSPAIELCVSSSGKPMQRPLSWRGWKTRPWIARLSGTTLRPSRAARGAAAFISSLPVIPASRSQAPGGGAAPRTRATSGRTSGASSRRSSPSGCSSRMSKGTSISAFPRSAKDYGEWASSLRRCLAQRLKSARVTRGPGYSCWPTPTACNNGNWVDIRLDAAGLAFEIPKGYVGKQKAPKTAATAWLLIWTLLTAAGYRPPAGDRRMCLSLPQVRVMLRLGTGHCGPRPIFNPLFLEWQMGWPTGWTDPGARVTGFARWLQRSRTELSGLLLRDQSPLETAGFR